MVACWGYDVKPLRWARLVIQAVIGMPLDVFVKAYDAPFPRHIKIDVDGAEDKIVAGGERTLPDARVRSVLVELNTELEGHRRVFELMRSWGFHCMSQVSSEMAERSTDFDTARNVLFERL